MNAVALVIRRGHAPSAGALAAHLRGQLAGFRVQHVLLRDEPSNQ